MSKVINVMLFIIFAIGALVVFGSVRQFVMGDNNSSTAVTSDPMFDFMRGIVLEATPVIMPDPVTIVREVNQLARLETASFVAEKVVRIDQGNTDILFGAFGDTIVFVAHGEVIAGIDLKQMDTADMQVIDPTTVMVHLPETEILVATLDNDKSYVVNRSTGLFAGDNDELETLARQSGENAILEAALEYGILLEAQANAEAYMEGFLQGLGFETIIFTAETPPTPAAPYEQIIPKGYVLTTPTPTP